MSVFFIVLKQEILLLSRGYQRLVNNMVFFAAFLTLFLIMHQRMQNHDMQEYDFSLLVCGTILAILTAILVFFGDFLRRDSEDGTVEQLMIANQNFEIVILAKILANWLASCVSLVIFGGILALAASSSLIIFLKIIAVLLLMSLSLSCICAFCGYLGSFGNSLALSAILAFPLSIPTILISNLAIISEFFPNFGLLTAITILALNIAIFGSAKLSKINDF